MGALLRPGPRRPTPPLLLLLVVVFATLPPCRGIGCDLDARASRRSCSAACVAGEPCAVRAAVLLPRDADEYEVALPRVLPVMAMAAEAVGRQGLWPPDLLIFLPGNDKCDAVYGQISAVDSYANDCAHVFFGPTCEYSVAPVGRMVKFWNTPLLTVGALTHDFTGNKTACEDEYHMMTRVGTLSFRDLADFVCTVMVEYSWKRIMMVYDKDGYRSLSGEHTCKLMMEALVKMLKTHQFQYSAFDTEKASAQGLKEHLRHEVGNAFSGEWQWQVDFSKELQEVFVSVCITFHSDEAVLLSLYAPGGKVGWRVPARTFPDNGSLARSGLVLIVLH